MHSKIQKCRIFARQGNFIVRMSIAILVVAMSFLVAADVACARGIDPKKLSRPSEQTVYVLNRNFVYKALINGLEAEYTIFPGTYTSEFAGNGGVFLRCAERCVEIKVIPQKPGEPTNVIYRDGGIFLSNDGGIIYFYKQSDGQVAGSTADASRQIATQNAPGGAPTATTDAGGALGSMMVNAFIYSGMGHIFFPKDEKPDAVLKNALILLPKTP